MACFFPDFVVDVENKAFGLFGGEKACDFLFVKEAFQFARFGCEILNKELHFVFPGVCGHGEFFQPDTMTNGKVETGPGADAVEFPQNEFLIFAVVQHPAESKSHLTAGVFRKVQ